MSYQTKLKIGAFSQMMQVTVKTLRHYEQKGLLIPAEVDEWTGYRYYTLAQMQKLNAIRDLQRLGFSLDEIQELYEEDLHSPSVRQISEKIEETERQLRLLIRRRNQLLDWRNARNKMNDMEKFSIQSLPEIIVASHREVIPNYEALGPLCVQTIGPEMQRLGLQCPPPGYCFTIEHNQEYRPTDIDIEYCEQIEPMAADGRDVLAEGFGNRIIQCKRLPAVSKALCMKHVGPYDRFYASFTEAFAYLEEHGWKINGQPRTSYVDGIWNQADPEKWLSIIQIPIE